MADADFSNVAHSYRFKVIIGGNEFGFQRMSGLKRTVESIEYREGNNPLYKRKMPGQITYDDVTLERGFVLDINLENWRRGIEPGFSSDLREEIIIIVFERDGTTPIVGYTLHEAWVKEDGIGDLDADANDVLIQTMVIAFDNYTEEEV